MEFKINEEELTALRGLPCFHQVLYICGLRPFMDYSSGVVGIKRRLKYQQLKEVLETTSSQSVKSDRSRTSKIQRALKKLEKLGLIKPEGNLVFLLVLATSDQSGQKKADTQAVSQVCAANNGLIKKMSEGESGSRYRSRYTSGVREDSYIYNAREAMNNSTAGFQSRFMDDTYFDQFYSLYPRKMRKMRAQQIWHTIELDKHITAILSDIEQRLDGGEWKGAKIQYIPSAALYLSERRWEDEPEKELKNGPGKQGQWQDGKIGPVDSLVERVRKQRLTKRLG